MNFFKRAFYYTKEKIGKSLLLFVIFLFIANLVLAGFAIQNASNLSLKQTREQLGSTVTLSGARQQPQQDSNGTPSNVRGEQAKIDVSVVESLLASGYVSNYDYVVQTTAVASDFSAYTDTSSEIEESNTNTSMQFPGGMQGDAGSETNNSMFNSSATNMIYGVLNLEYASDFQSGTNTLTSGRYLTSADKDDMVVVIEQELADLNGLVVDDTISLKKEDDSVAKTYTIVGIYKASSTDTSSGFSGMQGFSLMDASNRIYMSYYEANELAESDNYEQVSSVVFYLTDPNDIDAFKEYASTIVGLDSDTYTLDANDVAYQRVAESIEKTTVFAKVMVIITVVAGSIILLLIIMLAIRERQYEIGVLLSLGEGKLKIILQFVTELLIVFLVAGALTLVTGNYVSKQVATLITSTSSEEETTNNGMVGGGFGGTTGGPNGNFGGGGNMPNQNSTLNMTEAQTELEVNPGLSDYLMMFCAGIIIIIVATAIPALIVLRKKPKEILTKN